MFLSFFFIHNNFLSITLKPKLPQGFLSLLKENQFDLPLLEVIQLLWNT